LENTQKAAPKWDFLKNFGPPFAQITAHRALRLRVSLGFFTGLKARGGNCEQESP
jgi:hypothetical protein